MAGLLRGVISGASGAFLHVSGAFAAEPDGFDLRFLPLFLGLRTLHINCKTA